MLTFTLEIENPKPLNKSNVPISKTLELEQLNIDFDNGAEFTFISKIPPVRNPQYMIIMKDEQQRNVEKFIVEQLELFFNQ